MTEFAAVFNAELVDGVTGFRLGGDVFAGQIGAEVASGGDINGDGFDDLLISTPQSSASHYGEAWLVFGAAASPYFESLGSRMAASTAYRFQGEAEYDFAGYSISNAGDVNGDGFDDFIIGAPFADAGSGCSYLVFGGSGNLEALDSADGTDDNQIALANVSLGRGYRLTGSPGFEWSGISVAGVGDVNGDGMADLLVGAPYASPVGSTLFSSVGSSYLVFGGFRIGLLDNEDGSVDGRIDLSLMQSVEGARIDGPADSLLERTGWSVSGAGDVNGDGFNDMIIGAPDADPNGANANEGVAYLVFGKSHLSYANATLDLRTLDGVNGTRLDGVSAGDRAGITVGGLGDINRDGRDDIIIGATNASPSGAASGSAYVVFGKPSFGASLDLSSLNGFNGFRIDGIRTNDQAGLAVSNAGDVNGDGYGDILVTTQSHPGIVTIPGAAYVIFGKESGVPAVVDLGSLDGNTGFRIEQNEIGKAAAAGDINNDGFDDIVLGARYDFSPSPSGYLAQAGSVYVVYGHRADTAVTRLGNDSDNTINGGRGSDTISGFSGNDRLIGWEGDDLMSGGDGNDVISGGAGFDDISGGTGDDTIDGGDDSDVIHGSVGADSINGESGDDNLWGDDGNDLLDGGSDDDHMSGGAGNDTLTGGDGDDVIDAGSGNDTVNAGNQDDVVDGFSGFDTLNGGAGDDVIHGGSGNDRITGGNGNDVLSGGSGRDIFIMGTGEDNIAGGGDRDVLDFQSFGGTAISIDLATGVYTHPISGEVQTFRSVEDVRGTIGADSISGSAAANLLIGGLGNDTLAGAGGNDVLSGGAGQDIMTGGDGSDRYIFADAGDSSVSAPDEITDFTVAPTANSSFVDRIDMSAIDAMATPAGNDVFTFIGQADFTAEGQIRASQVGADTLIEINIAGTSDAEMAILLRNFAVDDLTTADFLL